MPAQIIKVSQLNRYVRAQLEEITQKCILLQLSPHIG